MQPQHRCSFRRRSPLQSGPVVAPILLRCRSGAARAFTLRDLPVGPEVLERLNEQIPWPGVAGVLMVVQPFSQTVDFVFRQFAVVGYRIDHRHQLCWIVTVHSCVESYCFQPPRRADLASASRSRRCARYCRDVRPSGSGVFCSIGAENVLRQIARMRGVSLPTRPCALDVPVTVTPLVCNLAAVLRKCSKRL